VRSKSRLLGVTGCSCAASECSPQELIRPSLGATPKMGSVLLSPKDGIRSSECLERCTRRLTGRRSSTVRDRHGDNHAESDPTALMIRKLRRMRRIRFPGWRLGRWPDSISRISGAHLVVQRDVADDFPAKEGAHPSELSRIVAAKNNDTFWMKGNGKRFALSVKRHHASVGEIGIQRLSGLSASPGPDCARPTYFRYGQTG
jgi:hypothetical protein